MSRRYTQASLRSLWDKALRTSGAIKNTDSKLELLVKPGEGTARPGSEQEEEEDVAILRAGREEEGQEMINRAGPGSG